MASTLEQLDDESLLLMYLAGELPAGQRTAVETRLAGDRALQAKLQSLQSLQEQSDSLLERADQIDPLPVKQDAAVRRIRRIIDRWHADRLAAMAAPAAPQRSLRYPWWAYPLATAAAIFLAFVVWWKNIDGNGNYIAGPQPPDGFMQSPFSPEMEQFRQLELSFSELASIQSFERELDALALLSETTQ